MNGIRHALIVATDTYQDDGLERLKSPGQDAVALADVLRDPEVGGFEVEILRNEPAHVLNRRVDDFFSDRHREDSLLLHFSCHGLKNDSGELFFAAADTVPRRLSSTAVSADFVRRSMNEGRARNVVLFLDCCYGGAFVTGMGTRASGNANVFDSFSEEAFDSGRGWAVITASSAMEYSFEGTELADDRQVRPSVFTRALAAGLASGEADLDADGRVSVNELYDYVYDQVRRENPHQTPSRSFHLQGDVYLAHSKRRRTDTEGLPQALRSAVASPDVFTRRGAVPELRDRLQSPDPEIAEVASQALHGLVLNDIRSIADEASHALDEVAVRPSPRALDFGRVVQDSPAPHRRVQLLGPALAHECVPHPREPWIHVVEVTDGLDVSVETARTGRLEGPLVLEGRAGGASVSVRVEVVPAPVPAEPAPTPAPRSTGGGGGQAAVSARPVSPAPPPVHRPANGTASGPVVPGPRAPDPGLRGSQVPPTARSLAGFGQRLAARTIDYVMVLFFAGAAVFAVVLIASVLSAPSSSMDTLADIVLVLFFLGWGVLLFFYDWIFLRHLGATFGKMLLRIRVVDAADGGRLSRGQAAGRAAVFGLPQTIAFLGQFVVFFESFTAKGDPLGQALHDSWAGTVVVRDPPEEGH
ncbi:RDD family protein [Nocardiopsis sp. CT-R113]|uniref:RDD family protein n=1 Tax=Nocardiopsis codii TaxID=3065942 RepID=A0ABU7K9A2_9ACTN|nr:RDD family protein [Nocardiopsis sp. CT-R113]MEE2038815.1 RDD family protein [Nocardiopsis sp. CT-R113]